MKQITCRTAAAGVIFALWAVDSGAVAHTAWLRPEPGVPGIFRLYFGGHGGRLEPYRADKLKEVTALDASGMVLGTSRKGSDASVLVHVKGDPALIYLHYDNGVHSRTGTGPSIEKPMNEVVGALSATHAVKYGKTIAKWGSVVVTRPVGHPFEMVPISAQAPAAGEIMRVKVLINGQPAAGVRIGKGEDAGGEVTDADGIAVYAPSKGFNRIWAGKRVPVRSEPSHTELSYEYALGFEVR